MSMKENGGPAFPVIETVYGARGSEISIAHPGMSLRDYFAAKAMAACISNMNANLGVSYEANNKNLAMASYAIADAMLSERSR